jgi:hypothetical protein
MLTSVHSGSLAARSVKLASAASPTALGAPCSSATSRPPASASATSHVSRAITSRWASLSTMALAAATGVEDLTALDRRLSRRLRTVERRFVSATRRTLACSELHVSFGPTTC